MLSNNFLRSPTKGFAAVAFALFTSLLVVACGGGDSVTKTPTYTIGGSVSGLVGSGLVLQDNGVDSLTVSASGSFAFATPLTNGSSYAVTVATQPTNPAQTCVVTSGSGTVNGANVQSIAVACSTNGYTVGGAVSGLIGSGLVLQDNGGDDLPISAAGTFTFSQTVGSGVAYAVTVKTQPTNPNQTCTVVAGSGTMGSANVTDVAVNCATSTFTVSGTVSGLAGSGLILQDNAGDDLPIPANGNFSFATAVASGATYAVTVKTAPTNPTQTCTITNGTGTIGAANITNVAVVCAVNTYTVGGSVTGLTGAGLVLKTNGANPVSIASAGNYIFATLASGTAYVVSVGTQPTNPSQTCVVTAGSGTILSSNVTNVVVTCTTNTYAVGGTASGVSGTGLTVLTNGANPVPVAGNGPFTSATLASGTTYAVTPGTQPTNPSQTCVVTNGSGTVTTAAISNITVTCTTTNYSVGGTVSGLSGSGLALENGPGGTAIPIAANGAGLTYLTLPSNGTYNIMVKAQPTSPSQTCVVANHSGTVTNLAITNVNVSCTTNMYTVGGTITGYTGTGTALVLLDNGTDSVTVTGGAGTFTFATTLINGAAYAVTVQTQPQTPAQYCTVANGAGSITAANVTNVAISCRNEGIYAFVADGDAASVTSFTIASNTGSLGFVDTAALPAGSNPQGIAIEVLPAGAGTFAYTADFGTADIGIFSVNSGTGAVTYQGVVSTGTAPTLGFTLGAGSTPTSITVDPSGQFLLVADSANGYNAPPCGAPLPPCGPVPPSGAVLVYQINQANGTLTAASGSPFVSSLAAPGNATSNVTVDPSDLFAFATNQFVPSLAGFNFNPPVNSGNLTELTPWETPTGANPVWITVDPLDRFVYVSNNTDGTISGWALGAGGALTPIFDSPFALPVSGTPGAIAIDPSGRFLYVTDGAHSQVVGYTIDRSAGATAGALTQMTAPFPTDPGGGPFAVSIDPSGHFLYVGNSFLGTVSMFTTDPTTGFLTAVGAGTVSYAGAVGVNAIAIE
jgi:6-phosphogluconolactonase (cycloisomerase 2 family)